MPVALNTSSTNAQIVQLQRQSATASHIAKLLSEYKARLTESWSGVETDYFCGVIEAQIRECENLAEESNRLCQDIVRAMEEILTKETAIAATSDPT
jgi:hypothetical protein